MRSCFGLYYFFITLAVLCIFATDGFAEPLKKRPHTKRLSLSSNTHDMYDFRLSTSVNELVYDSDEYDSITISQLRMLLENAQPSGDPDGVDPYQQRRLAKKALAMQFGRSFSYHINRSELGPTYRSAIRGYQSFQRQFQYSLQDTGENLVLTKQRLGKKWLELNLELNIKEGLEPQITIGDIMRLRYDYIYNRTMLEYGFNF